jgi:hypothetical protein
MVILEDRPFASGIGEGGRCGVKMRSPEDLAGRRVEYALILAPFDRPGEQFIAQILEDGEASGNVMSEGLRS